ncbi:MAG: MBL fold metallo-hydrolase [Gemmatimonadetes bacterium]|nr:MBL fold metallo-hydrolase [Gemmatimonadota bacterium]
MILKLFFHEKLAQASYLLGCDATGEALVVDPNRVLEQYLEAARREGLRITHVTETHIHADYVSGSRELAHRTGARLLLSAEGGDDWSYRFAQGARATLLRDGDAFLVGNVHIEALHTPGHTPEHLAFLVTDTASADAPMGAFSGDCVFVGDVGRPDLLERAAGVQGASETAARQLCHSIQRFKGLPDYLQLWPAHGAGSACGKALGAVPQSTVGYEKRFNWAFAHQDESAFVRAVLAGQPEPPKYYAQMKRINRDGPPPMGGLRPPARLPDQRLEPLLAEGALIVDTRPAAAYAAAHVPGTINIPLNRAFPNWAGWLLPYDRDLYLTVDDDGAGSVDEAVQDLAFIGLDRVAGYFTSAAVHCAGARGAGSIREAWPAELAAPLVEGAVTVIDVRARGEWEAGHLPGVSNIPLGYLTDRLDEVPRDRPVVVHCQSGGRSAIAASLLEAHGFRDVINLRGGLSGWALAGLPVVREPE